MFQESLPPALYLEGPAYHKQEREKLQESSRSDGVEQTRNKDGSRKGPSSSFPRLAHHPNPCYDRKVN